jgi:hypothetical protein
MVAATISSKPTEKELRQIIRDRADRYRNDSPRERLAEVIDKYCDPLGYVPIADEQDREDFAAKAFSDTWADLRPSEVERLDQLLTDARARAAERAEAVILEELVAAALTFADEHPDAPRAAREAVAA